MSVRFDLKLEIPLRRSPCRLSAPWLSQNVQYRSSKYDSVQTRDIAKPFEVTSDIFQKFPEEDDGNEPPAPKVGKNIAARAPARPSRLEMDT